MQGHPTRNTDSHEFGQIGGAIGGRRKKAGNGGGLGKSTFTIDPSCENIIRLVQGHPNSEFDQIGGRRIGRERRADNRHPYKNIIRLV